MRRRSAAPVRRARAVALFAAWSCVGALAALGVAALLTVGAVFLLAAAAVALVLVWRAGGQWASLFGLGFGAALLVAYVGWLNRDGPGTVCHATGQAGLECTDEWAPWPFYLVAVVLAASSIGLFAYFTRADHRR